MATIDATVLLLGDAGAPQTLVELERAASAQILERYQGNRQKTAEQLGSGLHTLYEKIKRYGLSSAQGLA